MGAMGDLIAWKEGCLRIVQRSHLRNNKIKREALRLQFNNGPVASGAVGHSTASLAKESPPRGDSHLAKGSALLLCYF